MLRHARYADDPRPADERCACYACSYFSRAYLRHLHMAREPLAVTLNTMHNVTYYERLMQEMRTAIEADAYQTFAAGVVAEEGQHPWPA